MTKFEFEIKDRINKNARNQPLLNAASSFMFESTLPKYSYNFLWQGRPIIQYPQDIVAMQELIWKVKPDLIIETGIAHGGSLIFSASMLALIELGVASNNKELLDPNKPKNMVLGIDIDIREHNRIAIENHPMYSRIKMIEGSSIEEETIKNVKSYASNFSKILVFLDSNHTSEHVLRELELYAPLVSKGSYCVVFDTVIEDLPSELFPDRPWGPGNSPKTAVKKFLSDNTEFKIDKDYDSKLLISVCPSGFLKKIR